MRKFALAAAMMIAGAAHAQEITIGVQADPSMDPHFMYVGTNVAIWEHMFGSLTITDDAALPHPSLAESYKLIDDKTWEFRLRPRVKFSDGSPLAAEDVVFSLRRVPDVPRNPSQYTPRLETVTGVEAVDAATVRIRTAVPNPRVPENMTNLAIVSKKAAEGQTTADFTSGTATVGSGPYKFAQFVPGDKLVVERNPHYWGPKPHWERVTFKVITNNAARVAALLSGDVDLIELLSTWRCSTSRW
jgi:peptide/nickel transport system substrate-binding protein